MKAVLDFYVGYIEPNYFVRNNNDFFRQKRAIKSPVRFTYVNEADLDGNVDVKIFKGEMDNVFEHPLKKFYSDKNEMLPF